MYTEGVKIILFSFILLILIKPFNGGLVQPLAKRLLGVGYVPPSKPWRWRGIWPPSWWGCLCACVKLAKSLPSGSFLFPPERT